MDRWGENKFPAGGLQLTAFCTQLIAAAKSTPAQLLMGAHILYVWEAKQRTSHQVQ